MIENERNKILKKYKKKLAMKFKRVNIVFRKSKKAIPLRWIKKTKNGD